MQTVTLTLESLSTDALRLLVPVLLDERNTQSQNMRQVRKIQARNVLAEIEKRTGWAETKLRSQHNV